VIDAERRLIWSTGARMAQQGALRLRPVAGAVELSRAAPGEPGARQVDARGRLRLSRSVLRATGLAPGDRVVVAHVAGTHTRLVARADRFGVGLRAP